MLARFAGNLIEIGNRALDFVDELFEGIRRDVGIAAIGLKRQPLPIQFFDQIVLQVGAPRDIRDFEHRDQRRVMIERLILSDEKGKAPEQLF